MMSLRRFAALYLLSFGLYLYYWYYTTLKELKLSEGLDISPGWRTFGMFVPILNIYLLYDLFRRIDQAATRVGAGHQEGWWRRPGWMTAGYFIIAAVLSQVVAQFMPADPQLQTPALIWLGVPVTLLTLVPCAWILSKAQETMNMYLLKVAPGVTWPTSLSAGQVGVVIGGILLITAQFTALHLILIWAANFIASMPQSY
jgi:hypothetical protein